MLDYERPSRHTGIQRRFFDEMDLDMDKGIELNGEMIESPQKVQRTNYVAMSLLYGIENDNEGMISATCGYLANRLPGLKQIQATETGEEVTLDFIFDEIN